MPNTKSDGQSTMPTQPGRYSDPEGRYTHQAYWDGEQWTGETRLGRKEARKARERSFRNAWLTVGAVLGAAALLFWWVGTPTDLDDESQTLLSTEHLLDEKGITFSSPEGWTEMIWEQPDPTIWTYVISPDHQSNWIALDYIPNPELHRYASADEIDEAVADLESQGLVVVDGPDSIEYAGLPGFKTAFTGITGERTGKDLTARSILLYDESVTYRFTAQWDTEHETDVLTALEKVLTSLSVE